MSEAEFRTKRRQIFLTEHYFRLNAAYLPKAIEWEMEGIAKAIAEGIVDSSGQGGSFKERLNLLRLYYTAGEPIESLRPLYAETMRWFGKWHEAEHDYSVHLAKKTGQDLRLDMTPVEFADLFQFQLALDVVSLGVLLGEADQVREAVRLMGSSRHADMLFEAIVEPVVPDPSRTEEFFHEVPYGSLLDAVFTADTPEQSGTFVKQYLESWYKAFEGAPWHNGHLVKKEHQMPYFGYWAFEAAAICVIHGIDDTSFRDHMVYPKDLADWARANDVMAKLKPGSGPSGAATAAPVRCEAHQPCPHEGYWVTPAKAGSRRHFKQGELMPDLKSDYGLTIWYWDVNQSS